MAHSGLISQHAYARVKRDQVAEKAGYPLDAVIFVLSAVSNATGSGWGYDLAPDTVAPTLSVTAQDLCDRVGEVAKMLYPDTAYDYLQSIRLRRGVDVRAILDVLEQYGYVRVPADAFRSELAGIDLVREVQRPRRRFGPDPAKMDAKSAEIYQRIAAHVDAARLKHSADAIYYVLAALCRATGDPGHFSAPGEAQPVKRGVSARKLCDLVCELMQETLKAHAVDALLALRLRRGEDVRACIETLIDLGYCRQQEGDDLDDFTGINLLRDVQRQ